MLFTGSSSKVAVTVMTLRGVGANLLANPIIREQARSYKSIAILPPGADGVMASYP